MKTASSLFTLAVLSATLAAATPARAVSDIGFLPQCPEGSMFRILDAGCVPYNPARPDEGSGNDRSSSYNTNAAPAPVIAVSDRRLKHDLVRVGTAHGLPLYNFEYKGQTGLYQGVMAQDVLKVKPQAVSVGADGYYRVNYTMLGLKMKRLR